MDVRKTKAADDIFDALDWSEKLILEQYNFGDAAKQVVLAANQIEHNRLYSIFTPVAARRKDLLSIIGKAEDPDLRILAEVLDMHLEFTLQRMNLIKRRQIILRYGTTSDVFKKTGNFAHFNVNDFRYGEEAMRNIDDLFFTVSSMTKVLTHALGVIVKQRQPEGAVVAEEKSVKVTIDEDEQPDAEA